MPSGSFKAGVGPPPLRYRTPSPPRYAFEPLSPMILGITFDVLNQESQQNEDTLSENERSWVLEHKNNVQRMGCSSSVMDTFASIALASDSSQTVPKKPLEDGQYGQQACVSEHDCVGRSSKRVRSDKLPLSDIQPADSRPATSYSSNADTRRQEAELLLNFSQAARYAVSLFPRHRSTAVPGTYQSFTSQYCTQATASQHTMNLETAQVQDNSYNHVNTINRLNGEEPAILSEDNMPTSEQIPQNNVLQDKLSPTITTTMHYVKKDRMNGAMTESLKEPSQILHQDEAKEKEREANDNLSTVNESSVVDSPHFNHPTVLGNVGHLAKTNAQPLELEIATTEEPFLEVVKLHARPITPINGETSLTVVQSLNADTASTGDDRALESTIHAASLGAKSPITSDTTDTQMSTSQLETETSNIRELNAPSICAACNFSRNQLTIDTENNATSWISCDGCKSWFHFACAGFKTEREVRGVDKYRCKKCKPIHGATTYVRKSARAHSAIDYAGLNEGVLKTSDENPEHHYIKPIKDGNRKFHPENFARMCPELVTADYFEKGDGMREPIVIPAALNPRPPPLTRQEAENSVIDENMHVDTPHDLSILESWISTQVAYDVVRDDGQDALDMVVPRDLTVRQVAELYGPEERVEVIDVKSQNGEDKKWNMRRWVDYYESQGNKVVRNVISLEVSQSQLGRLIRRPKVVRDLDLQDSVWPAELQAKGDYPKVQFYCLMSVADCFTDFHIDFGGSSVFYHILKGKKTFFFIPPHEKHLKKYEEWCMSNAQNWTFLGDQTKECYRVDLSEGDTMLIPAGWIHAVWTPEDSLVIGGNFLTRMHYQMQIRVAQIEKATGVARKFRYPHFQKVLWYAALQYLEEDPIPNSVSQLLLAGQIFKRDRPTYDDLLSETDSSDFIPENYHARYYSKAELDGLPELGRYLQRTALIAMGNITEGISMDSRNAVKRSIPKMHGEPLDTVKKFALWYTWKRGNELIPHWAYPDHVPESKAPELTEKKLGVRALRRLEREAALQAFRVAPDRQSTRKMSQQISAATNESLGSQDQLSTRKSESPKSAALSLDVEGNAKRKQDFPTSQGLSQETLVKKQRTTANGGTPRSRKPACDSCRKRRRACKHRGEEDVPSTDTNVHRFAEASIPITSEANMENALNLRIKNDSNGKPLDVTTSRSLSNGSIKFVERPNPVKALGLPTPTKEVSSHDHKSNSPLKMSHVEIIRNDPGKTSLSTDYVAVADALLPSRPSQSVINGNNTHISPLRTPGRSKACNDCRKSKVYDVAVIA